MKKNTRFAFNAYLQQLARLNGVAVEELSSKFTVEPSVQQTLEDQIQQSAAFLTLINVTPVTEQSGHPPISICAGQFKRTGCCCQKIPRCNKAA